MASNRRIGSKSSETRKILLQAAEQLMREEGYAEVTSRKLARRAGLKPQLVHYYFRTMGDLFEELFRTSAGQYLEIVEEIARSDDPLARLFLLSSDPSTAVLQLEFLALANHRKEMHELIIEFGRKLNDRVADIVRAAMRAEGLALTRATPEELATIIETLSRGLAFAGKFSTERTEEARAVVLSWLRLLSAREEETAASRAS